jgi:outer membrane lipoprotein LolB
VNALGRRALRPATLKVQGLGRIRAGVLVGAIAATLAGCASIVAPGEADRDALSGRLSVRVESAAGEPARSLSAGFELRGDAERGSLNLSTPFGTVLAQARWSPQQVVLVTPQGQTPYADLPTLTRELLGEALPVAALFDWLRGRPWPGAESQATRSPDEAGFVQLGWQVTLARFDEGSIVAQRAEPPVVTVRARMDRP